jgi:hypothetical protein
MVNGQTPFFPFTIYHLLLIVMLAAARSKIKEESRARWGRALFFN